MNKTVSLVLGLLIVAGVGFVAYRQMGSQSPSPATTPAPSDNQESRGSLRSLLGIGKNLTCTITNQDGSGGAVFIAGDRVRGDFTGTGVQGGMMHMIQSEGYMNMWTDGSNQGTKIKIEAETDQESPAGDTAASQSVDLNAEVNYTCSPWGVDNSKFALPSGVTFTDFSEVMMDVDQKSVCDQITEPQAKAACLSAVN